MIIRLFMMTLQGHELNFVSTVRTFLIFIVIKYVMRMLIITVFIVRSHSEENPGSSSILVAELHDAIVRLLHKHSKLAVLDLMAIIRKSLPMPVNLAFLFIICCYEHCFPVHLLFSTDIAPF